MAGAIEDPFARLGFVESRLVRHSAEAHVAAAPEPGGTDALYAVFASDQVLVAGASALLDAREAARAGPRGLEVFLGRLDGRPVFAGDLDPGALAGLAEGGAVRPFDLRGLAMAGAVAAHELGLLATARSLLSWHARHGFCANCGSPTLVRAGGFRRECPTCEAHHFPRTDPVVIMMIRRGDACLLGRAPRFPDGMYSCLAGFLEPGETIEAAVRRETFEETRILVGAVAYRASQPWPFPSSLMIGCVAEALDDEIVVDPAELADARWFTRPEVGAMLERRAVFDADRSPASAQAPIGPPPMAIAHALMRAFADGLDGGR